VSFATTFGVPCNASYLARAYAELGQFDEAWGCICEAPTTLEKTNERFWEAEVHRVGGEIALMSGAPDGESASLFRPALAVARAQQAKSWELRAGGSGAIRASGEEAREPLAPVYERFTEGFDTLDLKEAKALLNELWRGTARGTRAGELLDVAIARGRPSIPRSTRSCTSNMSKPAPRSAGGC
jgi:predicted ATPase